MGIQYQTNGILLPPDMNTDPTFTQLLNSYSVQSVSLLDGVLPARYGYRTSGVIDIRTKSGCDDVRNNLMIGCLGYSLQSSAQEFLRPVASTREIP